MEEKTITLTVKEYERLLDRELFLDCLEGAGVDCWTGYDFALDFYDEAKKKEETNGTN